MNPPTSSPLPPDLEALVRRVMSVAELRFVDGREEVERELRAHFEDGLAAGVSAADLMKDFGDPTAAGRRIAMSRPRAARHSRRENGRLWMSPNEWMDEVKKAVKGLRRAPGFSFIVVTTLALGVGANTAIFTVLNAVLLAIKLIHGQGSAAFGVTAVVSLAIEVGIRRSGRCAGDGRFLLAAAATFLASFAVWLGSQNDGPLCDPGSWLQGHALWHLGCAASTALLYLYMRSQRSDGRSDGDVPSAIPLRRPQRNYGRNVPLIRGTT